jgi:hypothetical protein
MVGTRSQLIVVLGLWVGIPLTVGFRPQLVVVSGLSVGIRLTVGFLGFHGAFGYHEAFSQIFFFHNGFSAITKPFTTFFSFTMKSQLSGSLFTNFFFFHDGILAIKEPFHELFFFTMDSWLSRSLFTNFSFSQWNSGYHEAFS